MSDAIDYDDLAFIALELGNTKTAYLCQAKPRDIAAWLRGESAPNDEQAARLNLACDLFKELSMYQGEVMTRNWFTKTDVGLGEDSPVDAIQEDRFEDVRTAARQLMGK